MVKEVHVRQVVFTSVHEGTHKIVTILQSIVALAEKKGARGGSVSHVSLQSTSNTSKQTPGDSSYPRSLAVHLAAELQSAMQSLLPLQNQSPPSFDHSLPSICSDDQCSTKHPP